MAQKDQFLQAAGGSGSAEQTGRERFEQQNQNTNRSRKEDIASQIGEKSSDVSSIRETGGSGDRMENESSNERTDRS
ncbi:hypothetical protein HRH25_07140 [Flavisolibacter sp. BT320]|nr:hypothetical protein [Flavisolibacter longurius]